MRRKRRVRHSRFPASLFLIYLVTLLVMSGVHTGLIVLSDALELSGFASTVIPILYWSLVSLGLAAFTRAQVIKTYEKPVQQLARATEQVARGDFSVYVPPLHTPDKLDYLDRMILDFNKMVAELGSIETMKTDFISNVSHEIKTPLAVISNSAQMLRSDSLTQAGREEYLDSILGSVQRLSELVTNILKLNKMENQVIQPVAEPYDLCAQLSACALFFEAAWEKKHIDLDFECEDRTVISADREMLEIVWNNLLSNAIKFTPEGGTIRLRQTSQADAVTVTVSDTGCGMTPETMSHIFEKFYQGDPSHSTPGNGLGLALTLRILQISGGTITVTSAVGEGSVFTVRLPKEGTGES